MKKKLFAILASVLALIMALALAVPVFANLAPAGASANALFMSISRPAITYHVGDVIHYSVTVDVPLTSDSKLPCLQTDTATTFTDPHGNVQTFLTITSLLPGESVVFTAAGATYTKYNPSGSDPTRAALENGTAAMPASPSYVSDNTTYAGANPLLNYTIAAGDLVFNSGFYLVKALAHTGNVGGAHDFPSLNDSSHQDSNITTEVSIPNTTVGISAASSSISSNSSTLLTVTENNTGDVPLTGAHVVVLKNGANFMDLTAEPTSGDTSNIGVLDPGEVWTWSGLDTGLLNEDTTFQATGHGMDNSSPPVDITFQAGTPPKYPTEQASVIVTVTPPGPPVPELPAGALFGLGLLGIGGFIVIKKHRTAIT